MFNSPKDELKLSRRSRTHRGVLHAIVVFINHKNEGRLWYHNLMKKLARPVKVCKDRFRIQPKLAKLAFRALKLMFKGIENKKLRLRKR